MSNWRDRLQKQKDADKIKSDEERIKQFQVNDISFPSLATSNCWATSANLQPAVEEEDAHAPKPTFATLAKTWNEKLENDRLRAEARVAEDASSQRNQSEFRSSLFYRNTFGYSKSHAEDTYYEEEDEGGAYDEPTADTSDGWRTTEKKIRQRRTIVERPVFDPPPVEESSVWDHAGDDHY